MIHNFGQLCKHDGSACVDRFRGGNGHVKLGARCKLQGRAKIGKVLGSGGGNSQAMQFGDKPPSVCGMSNFVKFRELHKTIWTPSAIFGVDKSGPKYEFLRFKFKRN